MDSEEKVKEDMEDDKAFDDQDRDRDRKRAKGGATHMEGVDSMAPEVNGVAKETQASPNDELEAKAKNMAEQIMDMACDVVTNECCNKVLAQNLDDIVDGMVEDVVSNEEDELLLVADVGGKDFSPIIFSAGFGCEAELCGADPAECCRRQQQLAALHGLGSCSEPHGGVTPCNHSSGGRSPLPYGSS